MNTFITSLTLTELQAEFKQLGLPSFRAKQVMEWIYVKNALSYREMTNLPISLRQDLDTRFPFPEIKLIDKQVSTDGTRKYVLGFQDGRTIETVAIPSKVQNSQGEPQRLSVCFSTQVGCPMACAFCATGHEGFTRNLSVEEMVDQILFVTRDMNMRVSNLVAMGQGEGFLNYENLLKMLRIINAPWGLNIGARHITISTCGVTQGIKKLSEEAEQFTLAVSLHAARQKIRDQLMPKVVSTPLPKLRKALEEYTQKTKRRVSFEYLLIKDVNDSQEDLEALINYCKGLLCHVNLLPLNKIDSSPWKPVSNNTMHAWVSQLQKSGIEVSIRDSRGSDIQGACGQLKNSLKESL